MRLYSRFCVSTILVITALLSTACGKKGPLTLPESSQVKNEVTKDQASQSNQPDLRLISLQETK